MLTRSRKAFRAFLATGITAVLAATLVSAVPTTASAAPPTEIATFPADVLNDKALDQVVFAGATGVLHHPPRSTVMSWTDYSSGVTRSAPALDGVPDATIHPGGGDDVAVYGTAGDTLRVGVPGVGDLSSCPVPDGYRVEAVGANGTKAVVFRPGTSSPPSMKLLDLQTGSLDDVTGVPDTAVFDGTVYPDGMDHALLSYRPTVSATDTDHLLLDLTTGRGAQVPGIPASTDVTITPDVLAWPVATTAGTPGVAVLSQQRILAGGSQDPLVVALPASPAYAWLPDGSHLIAVPSGTTNGSVVDIPFDGGDPVTLLSEYTAAPILAADGSVLAAGADVPSDSVLHRYSTQSGGSTLTDDAVLQPSTSQPSNAGIVMAHGNLRHIEGFPQTGGHVLLRMFNHGIAPDIDPEGSPYGRRDGGIQYTYHDAHCAGDPSCVYTIDGASTGLTSLYTDSVDQTSLSTRYDNRIVGLGYYLGQGDYRLVDVSQNWVVVDSATTGEQYVIDPVRKIRLAGVPATGAALWQDTLYRATAAGTIVQYGLSANGPKSVRTIKTGGNCQVDEVQVAQHWLYWSCNGTAGVYDLISDASFAVPAGQAELGDGYLALRDSIGLQLIDVHADSGAEPVRLATLPVTTLPDDRNIDWTVDRYSGDVAYVSADDTVHVLKTGVPGSALTGTATNRPDQVSPRTSSDPWTSQVTFDRPVSAWRMTITRQATGKVVHTETGEASRQFAEASWDGKLVDGSLAPSGTYHFQWYGSVDGVSAPVAGATGTMQVWCGARAFRDYYCGGSGGLMRDDTTNFNAGLELGEGDGKLHAGPGTSYWPLGSGGYSMLIPFGDLDGDGHDDLLVRNNSGEVGGYLGDGGGYFERGVSKHVTIGSGYGGFTAIVSTGDLNGDGIDDLVVRNSAGVLYFKAGTGSSQFKPGVRFTAGWNKYVKLIGAGDLDGDGCGDLLAVDGDGVMWFYRGTKDGKFATKVRIGAGWAKYNAVIGVGDLTGDGIPDLIARDSAGTIWRYDGTGHATWSTKAQIATGWSKYALF